MLSLRPQPLTIEEFIERYSGLDEKYELIDGIAVAMAGGTIRHGLICANLLTTLSVKLRGTGCRPLGSDIRLKLDAGNIRFPDVSIYCDVAKLQEGGGQTASTPKVIFEVLSPSTERFDRVHKLLEYKKIESVDTIVLIDGGNRTLDVYERIGVLQWNNFALIGGLLKLRDPAVELTFDEIFADIEGRD